MPVIPSSSPVVAALAVVVLVAGCASPSEGPAPAEVRPPGSTVEGSAAVVLPAAGASFDYQLGGVSPPPPGTEVVVRDSTEEPAEGAYGICYVNGFQTQPGSVWPGGLLVETHGGSPLVDPGWPDEHLFDLSADSVRRAVAERHRATIDDCAEAGYRAVEFDNLDSWTRSRGAFGEDDAVAFAALLVEQAHSRGLAAAQKNTVDLGARGRDEAGFDFAITEECDRFDECPAYADVYGGLVFDIEYTDDLRGTVDAVCARVRTLSPAPAVIVRDRGLVPAGEGAHAYTAC